MAETRRNASSYPLPLTNQFAEDPENTPAVCMKTAPSPSPKITAAVYTVDSELLLGTKNATTLPAVRRPSFRVSSATMVLAQASLKLTSVCIPQRTTSSRSARVPTVCIFACMSLQDLGFHKLANATKASFKAHLDSVFNIIKGVTEACGFWGKI